MRTPSELQSEMAHYTNTLFHGEPSPLFAESKRRAETVGKAAISVSANEGRLLEFFLRQSGAQRVLEFGALTGYSALWMLQAMKKNLKPNEQGTFYTLELDPKHAGHCREVLAQAGLPANLKAEVIEGDARETLKQVEAKLNGEKLDAVFIDGNKAAYLDYLLWSEKNLKPDGLVLADNIFLRGQVFENANPEGGFSEKQIRIMREFNQRLADPKLYESVIIPTAEGLFVARLLG